MRRGWIVGGVGCFVLASFAWGRPGVVKTLDGQTFDGDITRQDDQILVDHKGIHSVVSRSRVQSISYYESAEQACRQRLARLTAYDVPGRLELAHWLFGNKEFELARQVLQEARSIQPRNADVQAMLETVDRQEELERREARKHAPVQLAAADNDPRDGVPPRRARPPAAAQAPRLLNPDEIQFIRQSEWQEGEKVSVRFQGDVRRQYVAREGIDPATFNRLPPARQAWAIIHKGTEQMRKDVILGDPPELLQFRQVQRSLLSAFANCHSVQKIEGNFALAWPSDSEAATYTNFLILQKYSVKVGGNKAPAGNRDAKAGNAKEAPQTFVMISRDRPEDSLLVQYALPPEMGQPPHPAEDNYRGVARTRNDGRLRTALNWIAALNPVAPDYSDIDVTPKPATRPARRGGNTVNRPRTRPAPQSAAPAQ